MRIYVGNLARDASEDDLRQAFEAFGKVSAVSIIRDRYTNESRGFAFVEMETKEQMQAAITGLHSKELKGRSLVVNEARPRTEGPRPSGFSFGGGGFGGGGGGGPRRGGGGRGGRGGPRGGGGGGRRDRW